MAREVIRTDELTHNAYSLFLLLGELDRSGVDLRDMYVTCRDGGTFERVMIVKETLSDNSETTDIALD